MKTRIGLLVPTLLLASCIHKYAVPEVAQPRAHLPSAAVLYVSTPKDGIDDRPRTYPQSGTWTSSAIASALRDRGMQVVLGAKPLERTQALEAARAANATFLIYTEIAHWSDRATEWSGIPDRIAIEITTYVVATGSLFDQQDIKASSRWATLGGDHPQELLPELTRRWTASLVD